MLNSLQNISAEENEVIRRKIGLCSHRKQLFKKNKKKKSRNNFSFFFSDIFLNIKQIDLIIENM